MEQNLNKAIQNRSLWDVYSSSDVNEASQILTQKINSVLDKMAPVKTFQTRTKYSPWLS